MNETNDVSNQVQELVWALLDDRATDEQVHRLETLLVEEDEARRVYVMCMQMHADLHLLFNPRKLQLPAAVEKAMQTTKAKQSNVPVSLLNLPPAPAGMPMTPAMF